MATQPWSEVRAASALDERCVAEYRQKFDDRVRAWRLGEIRRRQELTQEQVAGIMDNSTSHVAHLESGNLSNIEVAVLRSYINALGGRLRVVAEFGDDHLLLSG